VRNEGATKCSYEQRYGQCDNEYVKNKQCFFAHSFMPKAPRDGELLGDPGPCYICKEYGHSRMACPLKPHYAGKKKRSPSGSSGSSRRHSTR
jgi:hypothetical protein